MKKIGKWFAVGLFVTGLTGCSVPDLSGILESQKQPQTVIQESEADTPMDSENQAVAKPSDEQPTETKSEVSEPVISTVTITAVGDCTLGVTQTHGYAGSFHEYYDKFGENYFFDGVREIFEKDDFTLINLECVLSE